MTTPTPTTVQVKIQLRRDTAATWASVNPVLLAGEAGLETDTNKIKIGNGSTAWNSLGYFPFVVNGGTVTGNLEIGTTGTLTFEGSSADNFETTLGVINPTADRTINLPNVSGTIITTGDTGTVTSTMIADGTIVDADIAANAEIAVSKLADGAARQLLQTDAAGTGVEWTSNVDIPGTLDVTGTATFDGAVTVAGDLTVNGTTTTISTQNLLVEDKNIILGDVATPTDVTADGGGITLKGATDKTINWVDATDAWTSSERFSVPLGSAALPSLTFTGDENSGVYSPGADQVAISTGGSGRLFVDSAGQIGVGTTTLSAGYGTGRSLNLVNQSSVLFQNASSAWNATTAGGAITYFSDNNLYIDAKDSASNVIFRVNGASERLRITSAGLVGVGTSSPSQNLHVNSGGNTVLLVSSSFSGSVETAVQVDTVGDTSRANIYFSKSGTTRGSILYHHNATGSSERLQLSPAGSTGLNVLGSGNVGIGTTSPVTKHHVSMGSDNTIIGYFQGSSAGVRIGSSASPVFGTVQGVDATNGTTSFQPLFLTGSALLMGAGGAEHARIDSSGRLLVGTSSAFSNRLVQIEGTGSATTNLSIIRHEANANAPVLDFYKSRGTTNGSRALVADGDGTGSIIFAGADGTTHCINARIEAFIDGTPGANDMPGRLVFSTTADGASSPTERMRISNNGYVGINGTATRRLEVLETRASEFAAAITNSSATGHSLALVCNSSDTVGKYLDGYSSSASITRIAIFSNGNVVNTNNSYGAISDARLKENITDASSQWDDIKSVQVRNYNLKTDSNHRQIGVVAQEIEQVSPGLVYECPDRDADGNDLGTVTKSVNYSVLYMKAVKALQEAMERIEVLEQRLTDAGIA